MSRFLHFQAIVNTLSATARKRAADVIDRIEKADPGPFLVTEASLSGGDRSRTSLQAAQAGDVVPAQFLEECDRGYSRLHLLLEKQIP